MKKYSNEQRIKALNVLLKNDSLSINEQPTFNVFTILTQHFTGKTIEYIADYIITYQEFLKIYKYDSSSDFHFDNTNLTRKRFLIWMKHGRILTKKEEDKEIKKDVQYKKFMECLWKEQDEKYKDDMFKVLFPQFVKEKKNE